MINVEELYDYIKNRFDGTRILYYKKCIAKLDALKTTTKQIHKVSRHGYFLEPLRLYLTARSSDFMLFISKNRYKNATYIKYELDSQELVNFLMQIEFCEKYGSNLESLSKVKTAVIKEIIKDLGIDLKEKNVIYLNIISRKKDFPDKCYEIRNIYDSTGFLLGRNSFKILKYIDIEKLHKFLEHDFMFRQYSNYVHSLPEQDRDFCIVFGKYPLKLVGTQTSGNIEATRFIPDKDASFIKEHISKLNVEFNMNYLDKHMIFYSNKSNVLKYKKNEFMFQTPGSIGAGNIFDVYCNPKYHFWFGGMKFANLEYNLKWLLSTPTAPIFADFFNIQQKGYDFGDLLCLPTLSVNKGKLELFFGKHLDTFIGEMAGCLEKKYNLKISSKELQDKVKQCSQGNHDIYKGKPVHDPDTSIVKYFHLLVKDELMRKYCTGIDSLLDMGTGKLRDLRTWGSCGIKKIVGIEPSPDSIELAKKKLENSPLKENVTIINGFGDGDWNKDNKYRKVIETKFDAITFHFMLHYMMKNIDTVIRNIKAVSKKGTKIIITCMDGNLIQNDLVRSKKIEVRNAYEPIFAIIPKYEPTSAEVPNEDVLVYFRGSYGVSNGSSEPLIDIEKLIKKFNENGIKFVERKGFLDYNNKVRNKLSIMHTQISKYYMTLVFECN